MAKNASPAGSDSRTPGADAVPQQRGALGEAAGVGPQDRALTARRTQTGYMLHVIFKMLQEMCNRNKPLVNKSMVSF